MPGRPGLSGPRGEPRDPVSLCPCPSCRRGRTHTPRVSAHHSRFRLATTSESGATTRAATLLPPRPAPPSAAPPPPPTRRGSRRRARAALRPRLQQGWRGGVDGCWRRKAYCKRRGGGGRRGQGSNAAHRAARPARRVASSPRCLRLRGEGCGSSSLADRMLPCRAGVARGLTSVQQPPARILVWPQPGGDEGAPDLARAEEEAARRVDDARVRHVDGRRDVAPPAVPGESGRGPSGGGRRRGPDGSPEGREGRVRRTPRRPCARVALGLEAVDQRDIRVTDRAQDRLLAHKSAVAPAEPRRRPTARRPLPAFGL